MSEENINARLLRIARICVWWKDPEKTMRETDFFLAHALDLAIWEDAMFLVDWYGKERILQALSNAPGGVLRPRSWSFWHRWLSVDVPPLPRRAIQ